MAGIDNFQIRLPMLETLNVNLSITLSKTQRGKSFIIDLLRNHNEITFDHFPILENLHLAVLGHNPPEESKMSFLHIFKLLINRLIKWIEKYNNREFDAPLLEIWIDCIQWINNGLIDTSKSLKSIYDAQGLPDDFETWEILCNNCVENSIKDLWSQLEIIIYREMYLTRFDEFKDRHIFKAYWFQRIKRSKIFMTFFNEVFSLLRIYDNRNNDNIKMFVFSIIECNYTATIYYWQLLEIGQRFRAIDQLPFCIFYDNLILKCEDMNINVNQDIRNLIIFLLQKFIYYRRDDEMIRLLETKRIIKQLLHWPWCNVFLEIMINFPNAIRMDYYPLIIEICSSARGEDRHLTRRVYTQFFFEVFDKIISFENSNRDESRLALLISGNIDFLKTVIDDENFRDRRPMFFNIILHQFCRISCCDFCLYQLIKRVFSLTEENAEFLFYEILWYIHTGQINTDLMNFTRFRRHSI